ncbi:MAG: endolytic transglycosylase MltG [Flavobacteriaceae bacterium]
MNVKKLVALILVAIVLAASLYGYSVYKKIFTSNTSFEQREIYVYIPTETDYQQVKNILNPYIENMENFVMTAEKKGYLTNIRAGRFLLKNGMNNNDIVNALRQNIPLQLTFNNQETIEQLAGRIAQQIEPDSLSVLQAITDNDFLTENGFTQETALSMYIPNTYEFFWNSSVSQFRERMAKEYRRFWTEERLEKAKAQNLTPEQVSILAAIVHKETVKIDERSRVAGVYLNRLKKGMPLQADPTVIFAIKKHTGDWNKVIKRVLHKDTQFESVYNTYLITGLPPGPIAMPDISAIEAVLNPEKHDFMYFCASVERFGYHEFAKTLAQHNINAAKYQRWVRQQGY